MLRHSRQQHKGFESKSFSMQNCFVRVIPSSKVIDSKFNATASNRKRSTHDPYTSYTRTRPHSTVHWQRMGIYLLAASNPNDTPNSLRVIWNRNNGSRADLLELETDFEVFRAFFLFFFFFEKRLRHNTQYWISQDINRRIIIYCFAIHFVIWIFIVIFSFVFRTNSQFPFHAQNRENEKCRIISFWSAVRRQNWLGFGAQDTTCVYCVYSRICVESAIVCKRACNKCVVI